jgi:hypothetical protein
MLMFHHVTLAMTDVTSLPWRQSWPGGEITLWCECLMNDGKLPVWQGLLEGKAVTR